MSPVGRVKVAPAGAGDAHRWRCTSGYCRQSSLALSRNRGVLMVWHQEGAMAEGEKNRGSIGAQERALSPKEEMVL